MIYRIVNRQVWKNASLEQRSQWLEDLAFKSGGSGEVVIKCQSFKSYWTRQFRSWCSEGFIRKTLLLPIANWMVEKFGYTNVD